MEPLVHPPAGRLLYVHGDGAPYVLLRHDRTGALYLGEDGWTTASRAAGPLAPGEALRAWRIANVRVPEGCERGPWQWGIALLSPSPMPVAADGLSRFEPAWLPPSVSAYGVADVDRVANERCCAPPRDEPRVTWGTPPPWLLGRELVELARTLRPEVGEALGTLAREWNAHPAGSPVVATSAALDAFVVVDLP